jgi:hypothetical protein
MKKDSFELFRLDEDEFQDLSAHICVDILGTGVVVFAPGKDGGRDGTFSGTANAFPSRTRPASGEFVIQAKHTQEPYASAGDSSFAAIWKRELPKIKKLAAAGQCDVYLLFANRRVTAAKKTQMKADLKSVGVKKAEIFCRESITLTLQGNPALVRALGLDKYRPPFTIQPQDLSAVIKDFHQTLSSTAAGSLHDLSYTDMDTKNEVNRLSSEYFDYIKADSMPLFAQIRTFLENPRNSDLRAKYHATADEIKAKLITFSSTLTQFDEAFSVLYDHLTLNSAHLQSKRRLVHVFLHYMYCDCDIGKQHA